MYMPSLFSDSFFDGFMSDFMAREPRRNPAPLMRTDVKENEDNYQLEIDLPGYGKEDVTAQLDEGYMTITARKETSEEQKDSDGKYIRRERFTGSMKRSFYVGKNLKEEDISARFENGILTVLIPKEAPARVEEKKYIAIG